METGGPVVVWDIVYHRAIMPVGGTLIIPPEVGGRGAPIYRGNRKVEKPSCRNGSDFTIVEMWPLFGVRAFRGWLTRVSALGFLCGVLLSP